MSRKLLIAMTLVALAAAACTSSAEAPEVSKGKGRRFVPQVLDTQGDIGSSASVHVDADGAPVISYLGLPDRPSEGEIPESRTIEFPLTPAVLVASQANGAWTYAAVEEQDPALVVEREGSAPEPVDNLSVRSALGDDGTVHLVWVDANGLRYASGTGGTFTAETLAKGRGLFGPSITVDPRGGVWVAFYDGKDVKVASDAGGRWVTQEVATTGGCDKNCANTRTAITAAKIGPVVGFVDVFPRSANLTTAGGEWVIDTIEQGPGGFGMAMTTGPDGDPVVSYLGADGEVAAAGWDGRWSAETVDRTEASPSAWWTSDVAVDGQGVRWVTWYDPAADMVRLAAGAQGAYVKIDTPGTQGGVMPSVATTEDGEITWLAWQDHVNQNLMAGAYAAQEVQVAVRAPAEVVVPAPPAGGAPAPEPAPEPAPAPSEPTEPDAGGGGGKAVTLTIAAPVGSVASGFDKTTLEAPADTPIIIEFDNQDTGVPHDVDVKSTDGSSVLFDNEIITGPAQATYEIDPLPAGDYPFLCSVHPTTMTGTLKVK